MTCTANGHPKALQELAGKLASAADVSPAELDDSHTFIFVDVECAHLRDGLLPRSAPWDGTLCLNAIAQIAAVTAGDGQQQQQQQQQQQFNVYVTTPQGAANMQEAPEEAAVAAADKLDPAEALQAFFDWAKEQHMQQAGKDADLRRLILVSHYGFGYSFSILVQHAEKYGVRLPNFLLADSCLWVKATCGMTAPAKLEHLADELVHGGRRGVFERKRQLSQYALADAQAMSLIVPRLFAKNNMDKVGAAAAEVSGGGSSGGWKRQLLAVSTPMRHFVGRLGLQPKQMVME